MLCIDKCKSMFAETVLSTNIPWAVVGSSHR
jgi:lysozyme family protein